MPDLPELRFPAHPSAFSLSRENVPSFAEIVHRAQNNGGPAVLPSSFVLNHR